jgi:ribA/ribD-fused uncharacterized protein
MKAKNTMPTHIGSFKGVWNFMSNFYPVVVKLFIDEAGSIWDTPMSGGTEEVYPSVEHAFQAAKFLDPKIRTRFQWMNLAPGQAKNMAVYLKNKGLVRADWQDVSLGYMRGLLIQKFRYSILRRKLISTFGAELVEGNWWHDNFYGDCLCEDCANIPGQNHLGRLLMEVRAL